MHTQFLSLQPSNLRAWSRGPRVRYVSDSSVGELCNHVRIMFKVKLLVKSRTVLQFYFSFRNVPIQAHIYNGSMKQFFMMLIIGVYST